MHGLTVGLIGVTGAILWLASLAATNFNPVAISAGLLAVLWATGRRD